MYPPLLLKAMLKKYHQKDLPNDAMFLCVCVCFFL